MSTQTEAPALLSARTDRATPRAIRKFRPDIEGLRAIAVTSVVLSHLDLGVPGGYIGVDVFFVISGFLITRQLMGEFDRSGKISFRGFYARRVRRILPAATVVIVGTVLACWRWDSPLQVRSDALDGLFSAFSGINWRLAAGATNYFQSTTPSPFQHFWSLAVEEQFYAVWPLLLLLISVLAGRFGRRTSVIWSLLIIMAASLALSVTTTASSPSWAYFGTQTRAWELALGALLAVTVNVWTRMPPALASQLSWLGLGLILLCAFEYTSSTDYPGAAVIVPVLGSGMVIAGGSPGWSRSAELLLRRRPMQFLGRTSYSWYLTHWPFLIILPLALGHALTTSNKLVVLFGSLTLATVMFYVIEQPVRIVPWLARKPRRSLALGSVLVLTSVLTATTADSQVRIPGGTGGGAVVAQRGHAGLRAVESAVAAGTRLRALPANVTPPLTRAATDRPATSRRCLVGELTTTLAPQSVCTIGALGSHRTMALIGDSHANQWTPAVDAFGKANHWKIVLFMKAACPPGVYPDDVDPITNRLYTQCNLWRNRVFARLRALRPQLVVVASELRTLDIDPSGMVQAIHNYQAAGAKVIYLEDTPNPEVTGSMPNCLAKHAGAVQRCALRRSAPTTRLQGLIQRRVESTAAHAAGATLIDPTQWFCTATLCPPVINDMIVYEDGSHITATYARWLSPVMTGALKKAAGHILPGARHAERRRPQHGHRPRTGR